jgi:hypothetical protein
MAKIKFYLPESLYTQLLQAGSPREHLIIASREYMKSHTVPLNQEHPAGRPAFDEPSREIQIDLPGDVAVLDTSHVIVAIREYMARCGRIQVPPAPPATPFVPPPVEIDFSIGSPEWKKLRALDGSVRSLVERALREFTGSPDEDLMFESVHLTVAVALPAELAKQLPPTLKTRNLHIRTAIRAFLRKPRQESMK